MADFETVEHEDIPPPVRSDFAQVIFLNIAETYPTGAHIECRYKLTEQIIPHTKDWVGLFKVGWASPRDYYYYEYAPWPAQWKEGQEIESRIMFQSHRLPKNDGEFYQFCYVTSSGHVRGASLPFLFKKPRADDYVAVEDDDMELMIVKTKTVALEESLERVKNDKDSLIKERDNLEMERNSLLAKIIALEKQEKAAKESSEKTSAVLQEAREQLKVMKLEHRDMTLAIEGLQEKLGKIEAEKEELRKTLALKTASLEQLQTTMKSMNNEYDELKGKTRMLEEEKELFRNHFTSSESTLQTYICEIDELKKHTLQQEKVIREQGDTIQSLNDSNTDKANRIKKMDTVAKTDKTQLQAYKEKLVNTEDKLAAAENCKTMLNDEVKTLELSHSKLSACVEASKSEAYALKEHLKVYNEHWHAEKGQLNAEVARLIAVVDSREKDLDEMRQELQKATDTIVALEAQNEEERSCRNGQEEASLFALQKAQEHLTARYNRVKKSNEDAQAKLEEYIHASLQWQDRERALQREVEDLRERLMMGAEEYKLQVVERQRLERELRRAQRAARRGHSESVVTERSRLSDVEVEVEPPTDDDGNTADTECQETGTVEEPKPETSLENRLAELIFEVDARHSKKQKYKQLYQDEKEKASYLQRHYREMLESKEKEIASLKSQLDSVELQKARDVTPTRVMWQPPASTCNDVTPPSAVAPQMVMPLLPLPPPIEPTVLPSAKVAAVRACAEGFPDFASLTRSQMADFESELETGETVNKHEEDDDRFHDAAGEPQKMCPVCSTIFPADTSMEAYTMHVDTHVGPVCPVCSDVFARDTPHSEFESHVQAHFDSLQNN